MKKIEPGIGVTRREVLKTIAAGAMVGTFGARVSDNLASAAQVTDRAEAGRTGGGPFNILFILTDQERYFRPGELPKDFRLPAHERLTKKGIVFENHRINSCV